MHWITILLMGLAANLDNLGISIAYGVKETKISILSNIIIAFMSMLVAYIAITAGSTVNRFVSLSIANFFGSLLLCVLGFGTLLSKGLFKHGPFEKPELVDWDQNHVISWREAIYLGFILSSNCLASGIAIGANGISTIWTVISVGVFSLMTIGMGSHFGYLLTKTFIGKYSTYISGWMLIIIGVYEMLT